MPQHIPTATRIPVPGGKSVEEDVGRVHSATASASVARMQPPAGWSGPGQTPKFDEITLVLTGLVRIHHDGGVLDVRAGGGRSPPQVSGCGTPHPTLRTTWRSACRRSHRNFAHRKP